MFRGPRPSPAPQWPLKMRKRYVGGSVNAIAFVLRSEA